jgi:hypothetical protein
LSGFQAEDKIPSFVFVLQSLALVVGVFFMLVVARLFVDEHADIIIVVDVHKDTVNSCPSKLFGY